MPWVQSPGRATTWGHPSAFSISPIARLRHHLREVDKDEADIAGDVRRKPRVHIPAPSSGPRAWPILGRASPLGPTPIAGWRPSPQTAGWIEGSDLSLETPMRAAGILLHPTSLPGDGPCGDLGRGADRFLDWLASAGCTLWQVLPLVPPGAGFSPYDSPSATALGTHLLSIEDLVSEGLLDNRALDHRPQAGFRVDVHAVQEWKRPRIDEAADALAQRSPDAIAAFADERPWMRTWALYEALRHALHVDSWQDFPAPLRDREPRALKKANKTHQHGIQRALAAQLLVHRQWARVRQEAARRGIRIVGDVPIFVSGGSCDVWANRALFRGGNTGPAGRWRADPVTGVPPDYFAPLGQRWGNPHYNWPAHQADDFRWWRQRIRAVLDHCDIVRIDHFRGFAAAWEISADAPDATAGSWREAPGAALFAALKSELGGLPFIAEDLGIITPDVEKLRDDLGLPGMKVLQFAWGGTNQHTFLPHTWPSRRWVAYTGTHDTDTAVGWYQSATSREQHRMRVYCGRDGSEPGWDLVRLAWASVADMAIAPFQDVLGLDAAWRMNVPGEVDGNWTFRAPELPIWAAERLRGMAEAYGRFPESEQDD